MNIESRAPRFDVSAQSGNQLKHGRKKGPDCSGRDQGRFKDDLKCLEMLIGRKDVVKAAMDLKSKRF